MSSGIWTTPQAPRHGCGKTAFIEMDAGGCIILLPPGEVIAARIYACHQLLTEIFIQLDISDRRGGCLQNRARHQRGAFREDQRSHPSQAGYAGQSLLSVPSHAFPRGGCCFIPCPFSGFSPKGHMFQYSMSNSSADTAPPQANCLWTSAGQTGAAYRAQIEIAVRKRDSV